MEKGKVKFYQVISEGTGFLLLACHWLSLSHMSKPNCKGGHRKQLNFAAEDDGKCSLAAKEAGECSVVQEETEGEQAKVDEGLDLAVCIFKIPT